MCRSTAIMDSNGSIFIFGWVCVMVLVLSSPSQGGPLSEYGEEDASVDELIVNAATSTKEFEFFYDEKQKLLKVEYDIVYAEDEYIDRSEGDEDMDMLDDMELLDRKKRTAAVIVGIKGAKRWTDATIHYQYNQGDFLDNEKAKMLSAMDEWSKHTCLTFVESDSPNRILFKNEGGCFSRVGMVGGVQVVGMAKNCRYKGVTLHEVGHALGLHHEQTRPDRDKHVRIVSHNIPDPMKFNFEKLSWATLKDMGIPYDYSSIMHYGKNAFSVNGRATIVTVDRKMQETIGQQKGLSFRDVKTMNIMYNCKKATEGCTKEDSSCPGEGFVGKDCQCLCPGTPTQPCANGGGETDGGGEAIVKKKKTKVKEKECEDQHRSCSFWSTIGECSKNPSYMLLYCKSSCNNCGRVDKDQNKKAKTVTQASSCLDQHTSCPYWAGRGFCSYGFVRYMSSNCKKSCGRCPKAAPVAAVAHSEVSHCKDKDYNCKYWSSIGECTRNPAFMRSSCQLSCNLCGGTNNNQNTGVHHSYSSMNSAYSSCVDNSYQCPDWARIGECARNPAYMKTSCRKSCRLC